MADKAQFYLEQSLPELLDLKEKKLFSPQEIRAITKKRTSFEQALTRKVIRKADFLRYAEYEMNLESLRKQRKKRLQIKSKQSVSDWAGPRRIFFIFDRATKRFHGDIDLWLQYIDFAKAQKSNKTLGKLFASMLQYHPTNSDLWVLTAKHEIEWNGNMTAARNLMQRGLRLVKDSPTLWVEYFKLELLYLDKIYARRKVLGLDRTDEEIARDELITGFDDEDSSMPTIQTQEDKANDALVKDVEMSTLSTTSTNAALQGAIPEVIMRSATTAMPKNLSMLLQFYSALAEYESLPFRDTLLERITDMLTEDGIRADPQACLTRVILPLDLLKNDVNNHAFPDTFRESLAIYRQVSAEVNSPSQLVDLWTKYLQGLLKPDMEVNLRQAIIITIRKAYKSVELSKHQYGAWIKLEREIGGDPEGVKRIAMFNYPGIEHFE